MVEHMVYIAHGKVHKMEEVYERSVKWNLGDYSKYKCEITCIKSILEESAASGLMRKCLTRCVKDTRESGHVYQSEKYEEW